MSEKLLAVWMEETRDILGMVARRIVTGGRCPGIVKMAMGLGLRQSGQETSGTRLTPLLHVWTTWTRFWVDIKAGQEVPAEAIIGEFDERMD